jgi:hypothetical protein
VFGALLLVGLPGTINAQTIVGRISGTVTDASGAIIPGVTVTVTNEATKLTRTATTDDSGFYVVTNLPVGTYTVSVENKGFKKVSKTGYDLVADGRLTVDFTLEAGDVAETVEVISAVGETVNTTSGEVARVIDREQVQNLALNGGNYMQLASLIPGAALLNDDQLDLTTSLSVTGQSVNGNRGNTNNLTVDGGFNLDSGSNGSQINNVGIDFIQEVNIKTSNFSAEYGRNSGASINVVTRAGGNQFHGGAFHEFRNDVLDARSFFAPQRRKLRYNHFGWNFGGPIIKDKFFFFGGMEWKYIRRDTEPTRRSMPTSAELRGDFSRRLRGPDGIVGTADDGALRDPLNPASSCVGPTITNGVITRAAVRTGCFPGNIIPANRITADGRAIANVFSAMSRLAVFYDDSPTGNNAIFQQPNPFNFRQDILRLDYRFNEKHSIYGRYLHDDYDLIDPFGTFINSQLPTIPTNRLRPGTSYQVSHTWLITPQLINEAKANASWNGQRVPPVGDNWKRDTYGFIFPQLFTGGGRFEDGIPNVNVAGFATWRGPAQSLLSPTTDIAFNDNLSIIRGRHSVKTGLLIARNRKDQNGRSPYTGDVTFNTSGNSLTTNNALADALLGNFRTYTEAANDPIGFFRFTQFEAYVTDNWKVSPRLSLEIGVRYYYILPTYTQANNLVNFDPSLYNPARAVIVNPNNTIVPNSGNRFNGLIRAGDGVPLDELGRVPNGDAPDVLAVPAGAPRGLFQPAHRFAPRFGFAYAPFNDSRTAIRGGFGVFYDRAEGNIIFSSLNLPPFSGSSQFNNGNLSNPSGGTPAALAPFGEISAIDPNLDIPYTMSYSLSVQRELPYGFFFEAAYVGNLGRHLLRQPDINQPTFDALRANAALPSSQRAETNALRPYKGFSAIRMRLSDSNSNYNALQLYATKRKGDLTMTAGYTWSKALADTSGNGDNPEDPFNRRFNYGPVSFDRRHIFFTSYTYRFPFFRQLKGIGGAVLSGWEVSGITRFQTGQYLTVTADTSIGNRRADYIGGPVLLPDGERGPNRWINPDAFRPAPDDRRGTAGVGIVPGPGLQVWDISMRKQFAFTEQVRLRFQVDFFNAFNRANFRGGDVDTNYGSFNATTGGPSRASFGTISAAGPGRNIQFGLKLNF